MKRRTFIATLGGAAAWPLTARAQQQMPTIGFLSLNPVDNFLAVFRQNLKEVGYVEGQNVAIQYTSAQGRFDDLPRLATDLVDRKLPLIVAGDIASALAVRAASSDAIIVFLVGADPVKLGLVNSLNRPSGNATGIAWFIAQLEAKRIGLLHELRPNVTTVAALLNPNFPPSRDQLRDIQDAMDHLGVKLLVATVNVESEFDTAFTMLSQSGAKGLLVAASPFFYLNSEKIISLANRYAIPAMYEHRDFATAGGLMSYGTNISEMFGLLGIYVGRILKGEKPADLPVAQATKFEFVINLKTAKALGLEIRPQLLARADEVIE
jgi:putative tryptophan/tyrosine transport system substrate-binding protein